MTMSILFRCCYYCTVSFPVPEIDLDDSLIVAADDDDDAAVVDGHEYDLNGVDLVRSTLDFSDQ